MNTLMILSTAMAVLQVARPAQDADDAGRSDDRQQQLVEQLRSPDFEEREWASRTLMIEDQSILVDLQEVYALERDLEVRGRLQEIVKTILFRQAMANLGGFLGIHLLLVGPETESGLGPEQHGIRVQSVVADTAAARAGLREGDLIVEMDGESFDLEFTQTMFIQRVQAMPPGTFIDLIILRDGQSQPRTVELGVRPLHKLNTTNNLDPDQILGLEEAARSFTRWCAEAEARSGSR